MIVLRVPIQFMMLTQLFCGEAAFTVASSPPDVVNCYYYKQETQPGNDTYFRTMVGITRITQPRLYCAGQRCMLMCIYILFITMAEKVTVAFCHSPHWSEGSYLMPLHSK